MACSPLDRIGTSEIQQGNDSNSLLASSAPVPQGIAAVPDTIAFADSSSSIMDHSELAHFSAGITTSSSRMVSQEIPKELYQDLTVNPAKIAEVPQRLDFALLRHIVDNAVPPIHIDELLIQFDRICDLTGIENHQVVYRDQDNAITRVHARGSLENYYLQWVRNHLASENPSYRDIAREIDIVLKGIILELRAPTDGGVEDANRIVKKRTAIENLCCASEYFPIRRHIESFTAYRVLSFKKETVGEIVKEYIQEIKEGLFLNHYSLATQAIHMLNYIRRSVGAELGLDVSSTTLQDPYIEIGAHSTCSPDNRRDPHTQPAQFRAVFDKIYTPQYILSNMKNLLNKRIDSDVDFMCFISQFIADEISAHETAGRLVAADTVDMPMPYQNNYNHPSATYQLTDAGVKFLMVHFGILNCANPNGHLVRVAALV